MSRILSARKLAIGHAGQRIGEDISLELRKGEVVALLGANGSGKTTLLKTLLGLLPALDGEVRLSERPLQAWSVPERARRLAYVPQAGGSSFAFSVLDMVLMARTAHLGLLASPGKTDRVAAMQALEQLGIAGLAARLYPQLSGGQQQLVLLARALVQQPVALLLDEPTASLDFANQILVLEQLHALRTGGLTILFTTHQPEHALRLADRLLLFKQGRIARQGTPGQLGDTDTLAWLYDLQPAQVHQYLNMDWSKNHD